MVMKIRHCFFIGHKTCSAEFLGLGTPHTPMRSRLTTGLAAPDASTSIHSIKYTVWKCRKYFAGAWEANNATVGPIVRLGPSHVDVCDLGAVNTIFNFRDTFSKSEWYQRFNLAKTESMFSMLHSQDHKQRRKLLAGPLSESSLQNHAQTISDLSKLAIERMRSEMRSRGAADLCIWWLYMATDIVGELAFGESFKMLESGTVRFARRDLAWIEPFFRPG